jgi:hypothetical protein
MDWDGTRTHVRYRLTEQEEPMERSVSHEKIYQHSNYSFYVNPDATAPTGHSRWFCQKRRVFQRFSWMAGFS